MSRQGSKKNCSTTRSSCSHDEITTTTDISESAATSSSSTITEDSCHSSYHDPNLVCLSQQIKEHILQLKKCEAVIQRHVDSNVSLALARYTGGGQNPTGALLSMRKAHQNKFLLEHSIHARLQLHERRKLIKDALRMGNYNVGLQVHSEREQVRRILTELKQNQSNYVVPTDEQLLKELQQHLHKADKK